MILNTVLYGCHCSTSMPTSSYQQPTHISTHPCLSCPGAPTIMLFPWLFLLGSAQGDPGFQVVLQQGGLADEGWMLLRSPLPRVHSFSACHWQWTRLMNTRFAEDSIMYRFVLSLKLLVRLFIMIFL